MNLEKWNNFQGIVLKLIKSGNPELNAEETKELKKYCKNEWVPIGDVFDLLLGHLQANHSQVRLSAFQILDQLFNRSHAIRELTLEKLKRIVSLTLALEISDDLPPPKKFQSILKKSAIKALDEWNEKFGKHYSKLRISYDFLRTKKNVNFKKLVAQSKYEQEQELKKEAEEKRIADYQVYRTLAEYDEQNEAFKDCLFEANTCFGLLKSYVVTENIASDDGTRTSQKLILRECQDNSSIIQTIDDRTHQAANSFIPKLDKWIEDLIRNNGEQKDVLPLIKSKEKLSRMCVKYGKVEVIRSSKRKRRIVQKDGDSDESDFDEIDETEILRNIPEPERMKLSMEITKNKRLNTISSSTAAETTEVVADNEQPCSSTSDVQEPSKPAPKRRFLLPKRPLSEPLDEETDLGIHASAIVQFESLHRFWGTKDAEPEDLGVYADNIRSLNPNYCNVPGKFEPVKWSCRTPLKSGKLCPRMDRFKCPLHGKVVPRDKEGKPNGKQKELFEKSEVLMKTNAKDGSWQDVEKEVERATGEKLNYSRIKKARAAREPTNFVPLAQCTPATPRSRIEKKILNKRTLKSANARADKMDERRNNGAFDQQFNYALK